jgi:hypothetical protein
VRGSAGAQGAIENTSGSLLGFHITGITTWLEGSFENTQDSPQPTPEGSALICLRDDPGMEFLESPHSRAGHYTCNPSTGKVEKEWRV